MLQRRRFCQCLAWFVVAPRCAAAEPEPDSHPLDSATRRSIREAAESAIESTTRRLRSDPTDLSAFSRRGDACFNLSRFAEAVADYDAMTKLDPSLETSHWRRGIALFYAGRFDDAAKQFERYHSFDNVDRENGIWRFLCQTRSVGLAKARESLLKYEKDDREPFPAVFQLFAGSLNEDQILKQIEAARIPEEDRQSRQFYADLYIGLNHVVQDRPAQAQIALARAVKNEWPRSAGYGPRWMWHVSRIQWEELQKKPAKP